MTSATFNYFVPAKRGKHLLWQGRGLSRVSRAFNLELSDFDCSLSSSYFCFDRGATTSDSPYCQDIICVIFDWHPCCICIDLSSFVLHPQSRNGTPLEQRNLSPSGIRIIDERLELDTLMNQKCLLAKNILLS